MNQLLICIPFCKADAANASRLLDWIYVLNGRRPSGFALLACADDVHQEMVEKLKVAADIAFEQVDFIRVKQVNNANKVAAVNSMFKVTAQYVAKHYRTPWFWCEPDLTPLRPRWAWELAGSYYNQPRRYCGSMFRVGTTLHPARCIIYPPDAINEMDALCSGVTPFNVGAAKLLPMFTKTRLVSENPIVVPADCGKVGHECVAVHADKHGLALANCEAGLLAQNNRRMEAFATA
jgi:hypothetical protein